MSIVRSMQTSSRGLNNDLVKISNWAFQWKMSYNPDQTKTAQKVFFCRKAHKTPPLYTCSLKSYRAGIFPETLYYILGYSIGF